jgi:hypothetical protein
VYVTAVGVTSLNEVAPVVKWRVAVLSVRQLTAEKRGWNLASKWGRKWVSGAQRHNRLVIAPGPRPDGAIDPSLRQRRDLGRSLQPQEWGGGVRSCVRGKWH